MAPRVERAASPLTSPDATYALLAGVDTQLAYHDANKLQMKKLDTIASSPRLRGSRSASHMSTIKKQQQGNAAAFPTLSTPATKKGAWTHTPGTVTFAVDATTSSAPPPPLPLGLDAQPTASTDSPQLSPTREPQWSPRRTTRLQGTTLTTALTFVEKDLALRRSSAMASGANVSTAEAWLEDMLELVTIEGGQKGGSPSLHGLTRAKMSRQQLYAEGLDASQAAQLYTCLFVHSFGVHQSMKDLLRPCNANARAKVGSRFIRALVAISERLVRTNIHSELVEMLHGMEDEVANVTAEASEKLDAARHNEAELSRAVTAALKRVDVATASDVRSRAESDVVRLELPKIDEVVMELEAALEAARLAESGVREELTIARREFERSSGQQSAEATQRANKEERTRAHLATKMAEAQHGVRSLEEKLARALSESERDRTAAANMQREMETAKWREGAMARERDESRHAAEASAGQLLRQLALSRKVAARNEEDNRVMAYELKAHEAGWRSSARLAHDAASVVAMYEAVFPAELAHAEECAVEAVAREKREGARALRAATVRAGVERRALSADVLELEEAAESLDWQVRQTSEEKRAFKGVVAARAETLQIDLEVERVRRAALERSLQDADAAYRLLFAEAAAGRGAWSVEVQELEKQAHAALSHSANLSAQLARDRERLENSMEFMKLEHAQKIADVDAAIAAATRDANASHAAAIECALAELRACEDAQGEMHIAFDAQSMRYQRQLQGSFLRREIDRRVAARRQERLSASIAELEAAATESHDELAHRERTIVELRAAVTDSETARSNAGDEAAQLAHELGNQLAAYRARAEYAEGRYVALESEVRALKSELKGISGARAVETAALIATLGDAEAEMEAEREAREEQMSAEQHAIQGEVDRLKADLEAQMRVAAASAESHADSLEQEIRAAEEAATANLLASRRAEDVAAAEVTELRKALAAETAARAQEEASVDELSTTLADVEAQLATFEGRARLAEEEIDDLRSKLDASGAQLLQTQATLADTASQRFAADGELAAVNGQLESSAGELADARAKLHDSEEQAAALQTELAEARESLEAAQAFAKAAAEQADLEAAQALQTASDEAKRAEEALRSDLSAINAQLAAERAKREEESAAIAAERAVIAEDRPTAAAALAGAALSAAEDRITMLVAEVETAKQQAAAATEQVEAVMEAAAEATELAAAREAEALAAKEAAAAAQERAEVAMEEAAASPIDPPAPTRRPFSAAPKATAAAASGPARPSSAAGAGATVASSEGDEIGEVQKRAQAAEAAAKHAASETARVQMELESIAPKLEEWQRRFASRVDASTMPREVTASPEPSEGLFSPEGASQLSVESENLLPEAVLSKLISEIYVEMSASEKANDGGELTARPLPEFIEHKYLRKFGLKKMSDENLRSLLASVREWSTANRKIATFGRFCGIDSPLSSECLRVYLAFLGVARDLHGKEFGPEWLGSDSQPFHVAPEVAMLSVRAIFASSLTAERLRQLGKRVVGLMGEVRSKRGVEQLVDFDALSDLVIEEHRAESTLAVRYLEGTFLMADVDGDGLITFDEFAELVRNVEPTLSAQRISALFAECLRESDGDGIRPAAFAVCLVRYGLPLRARAKATVKLAAKASLQVLGELWTATRAQLNKIDEAERANLQSALDEISALLEEETPSDATEERAWLLYRHVTAELAELGARRSDQ